jgi:YVTN family beta-propeller protein
MEKKLFLFIILLSQNIFLLEKITAQKMPEKKIENKTLNKTLNQKDFNADLYKTLTRQRVQLPNQWQITPAGSYSLQLGDLPLNAVWSSSKKLLAVTNNGVGKQFLQLFDASGEKLVQTSELIIAKAWYGLAFSKDEKYLYASGGNDNTIIISKIGDDKKLVHEGVIQLAATGWPKEKVGPTGIALDDATDRLFTATKEDSTLYVCSIKERKVLKKIKLGTEAYAVLISDKRKELYVSLWGEKKIRVFDLATLQLKHDIAVGDHPNEFILDKNQKTLYVANSLDNSVSIVDLKKQKVIETLNTALYPNSPDGSTTNSVALSDDEKKLYIANADNNCLAVFDVSQRGHSVSSGFIPTGWYPTMVRTLKNKLIVVNGKGFSSQANPRGPSPLSKREDNRAAQYIGALFLGTLSVLDQPDAAQLGAYSRLVYENTPYNKEKEKLAEGEKNNPIPMRVGDTSPIKYVFYIIKENRTYDQVLGDMKEGNGDSTLCLFPEKITPNEHAISRGFTLFDNFYDDAEVSADGHNWSTAAYANDFVEKTWPTSYGGRGGNYDYEGTRKIAYPKNGFIWDYCKRAGVSYRTYGEFVDDGKVSYKTLEGHWCTYYPGFDMKYKDVQREKDWERDFDSLVALKQVPHFNSVRLSSDHTSGLSRGSFTPTANVADNDQGVGRFVEHLSQSPIWAQSAVFILEDDAQNGADHVDAHRSTAFVISPYTKRNFVDHTMYSTSSMVRTIELILGLPPMSQYDAAATPMWRSFTNQKNVTPFISVSPKTDINEKNVAENELSKQSETFNLAKADAAPDKELNEVIWKSVKGINSEMPAPKRAAFIAVKVKDED